MKKNNIHKRKREREKEEREREREREREPRNENKIDQFKTCSGTLHMHPLSYETIMDGTRIESGDESAREVLVPEDTVRKERYDASPGERSD